MLLIFFDKFNFVEFLSRLIGKNKVVFLYFRSLKFCFSLGLYYFWTKAFK